MEKTETKRVQALKAHLALNVKNVEQSTEFYKKMLGIEPSKVRRGYAKFNVENPPLNLTLNEVAFKERGALSHLGVQVASTEDVLTMREKWALQDKTWVHDPDGNEWEVFVVLEDNLTETAECCATAQAVGSNAQASACATTDASISSTTETASCCGAQPQAVEIGALQR